MRLRPQMCLAAGRMPKPVSYTHLDVYKRQVYGNHELRRIAASGRDEIGPALERAGVQLLHTSGTRVEKDGAFINLIGVEDPAGLPERPRRSQMTQAVDEMLARVTHGVAPDEFTILLAHRPEFLTLYAGYPIDLVTAGHAHGGQVQSLIHI